MRSNYYLDPESIKFDDKYVVFNPLHNELEYEATKMNIQKLGQLEPILMLDGVCIDGRHRTSIAKELGVQVLCKDIDPAATEQEIIMLCNKNVMSGRDYDTAQKAVQALKLVNDYSMPIVVAAQLMKVDRRIVSYAATIKGYGRKDILEALMADKRNRIQLGNMERPSRSLELLAKFVKTESEKDVVVNDEERIQWKADAFIKTEAGKAWYYEMKDLIREVGEIKVDMLLAEMANMKFVIKGEKSETVEKEDPSRC